MMQLILSNVQDGCELFLIHSFGRHLFEKMKLCALILCKLYCLFLCNKENIYMSCYLMYVLAPLVNKVMPANSYNF